MRRIGSLLIPGLIFFLSLQLSHVEFFSRLEKISYDFPFRWKNSPFIEDIVLVGITQDCLKRLGKYPFSRTYYAQLIDYLDRCGAKLIVFDIYFEVPSGREEDSLLIQATRKAGRVIFPIYAPGKLKKENNRGGVYQVEEIHHNLPALERYALGVGHINVLLDEDGILRRVPLFIEKDKIYPALSLLTYIRYRNIKTVKLEGGSLYLDNESVPLDENGHLLLPHYAKVNLLTLPFSQVEEGKYPPQIFKDKIVLIGQITHGLPNADILNVPIPGEGGRFGVLIQANTIAAFLYKEYISLFLIYLSFYIMLKKKFLVHILLLFSFLILNFLFTLLCFLKFHTVYPMVPTEMGLLLTFFATAFLNFRGIDISLAKKEFELKTIKEVSSLATVSEGKEIMEIMVDTVARSLKASACILRELIPGSGKLLPEALYVKSDIKKTDILEIESSFASSALNKEGLLEIPQLSRVKNLGRSIRGSLLVSPLKAEKGWIGTISVYWKKERGFREDERSLFMALLPQIAISLRNFQLYRDTKRVFLESIQALTAAIDAKDPYTEGHSERVTSLSLEIAEEMGLSQEERERLKLAALLHDIGKIGIEERILRKKGRLSDAEYSLIKSHTQVGAKILSPIHELRDIIPSVLHHHERMDGKGYPSGLKGEEIPLFARIISVADAFDAITSDRPYRKGLSVEEACREILSNQGTQFDPEVVKAFLRVMEKKKSLPKVSYPLC